MNLPNKLVKMRDEMAVRPKGGHEGTTRYYSEEFQAGFSAAAEEMMKQAEMLVEALKYYSAGSPVPYTEKLKIIGGFVLHAEMSVVAKQAISNWEAWKGDA